MDEVERMFHDLSRIAPFMEALEKSADAGMFYDLFSGSIVWTDELPKSAPVSLDCLRFILRYRTALLVGEPEPSLELFWQEARRRFPNWIGFSVERIAPSSEIAAYYNNERGRAIRRTRARDRQMSDKGT
jgi:hypothetical protein